MSGIAEKPKAKTTIERAATNDAVGHFWAESVFPNAAAIFTPPNASLQSIKDKAIFVLDTNALLVPYQIGKDSLGKIETTYQRLINEKRLLVPAQSAREFARHRTTKLTELHQKLLRLKSSQPFYQGSYPMLEALPEYRDMLELQKKLDSIKDEYAKSIDRVLDHIRHWNWDDPVSLLYRKLFTADIVVDLHRKRDELIEELQRRYENKIPPGYKDQGKPDDGIGDLIIWMTILQIGAQRKTSVVFVSGEEKADWWHRSENHALYARFELVDEFRRASSESTFHIIKSSQLLELFGASETVIAEVRNQEHLPDPQLEISINSDLAMAAHGTRIVSRWFANQGFEIENIFSGNKYCVLVLKKGDAKLYYAYIRCLTTSTDVKQELSNAEEQLAVVSESLQECMFVLVAPDFITANAIALEIMRLPHICRTIIGVIRGKDYFMVQDLASAF